MARGKYQEWLEPDNLLKLEAWARDGLTDEQIAHNMGIAYSTLRVWKEKYSAISAALKKGKEVIDIQVENALLKRALGYSYNEVTRERIIDKKTGENSLEITKTITKEVSPEVTAQIFWLKNRKPEEWRDRKETRIDGDLNVTNEYETMSDEDLDKLVKRYAEAVKD